MKEKDEYVQKLKAKIDEWNADIDKLSAKASQLQLDSKEEYQKQIEDIKTKRKTLEEKLDNISAAGDDAWKDIKSGLDLAWQAMNDAVKSAAERFK